MKKKILFIITVLIAIICAVALAGCNGNDAELKERESNIVAGREFFQSMEGTICAAIKNCVTVADDGSYMPMQLEVSIDGGNNWMMTGATGECKADTTEMYYIVASPYYKPDGSFTEFRLTKQDGTDIRLQGGDVITNPMFRIAENDGYRAGEPVTVRGSVTVRVAPEGLFSFDEFSYLGFGYDGQFWNVTDENTPTVKYAIYAANNMVKPGSLVITSGETENSYIFAIEELAEAEYDNIGEYEYRIIKLSDPQQVSDSTYLSEMRPDIGGFTTITKDGIAYSANNKLYSDTEQIEEDGSTTIYRNYHITVLVRKKGSATVMPSRIQIVEIDLENVKIK